MKKSRKKMLLSSIAMLLVALVALGSATFAWYITNATVTAEKTQFSAASADGLVIRHTKSDTWSDKVTDLATKSSLTPAAMNYDTLGNVFGATGQGTGFDDGTLKGDLSAAAVTNGNVFLVDSFYVASSTGTAKDATFTIKSGTKAGTYLNLAVYVGSTLQGVWTSDPTAERTSTIKIGGTAASPETSTNTQTLQKLAAETNAGTISAATKESDGTQITVIGFVDGYNPLCKNSTADISTINVEYSFTAANSAP